MKIFRYLIWTSDQKKSYQITQNLAVFCKLIDLILGWNCVKDLIATKIVKKNQVCRGLELVRSKNVFLETTMDKIFETDLVFIWNIALWENVNLCFSAVFCYYWQNFYFGSKTGDKVIILWVLRFSLSFVIS